MHTTPTPTIGRIVIYRSRTGDYDVPAIVSATMDSLYQPNVDAGHVPAVSGDRHVHLTVFSPGPGGRRADAPDFKVESPHGRAENLGGTYTEWDIPEATGEIEPGTWRWPVVP